jgi:hypothetical protein
MGGDEAGLPGRAARWRLEPKPAWLAGFDLWVANSAKGLVSRILFNAVIPLGGALPLALISDLPGGFGNFTEPPGRIGPMRSRGTVPACGFPPYLVLLRVGFTLPPPLLAERCALTAPFHPYPGAAPAANSIEADRPRVSRQKTG